MLQSWHIAINGCFIILAVYIRYNICIHEFFYNTLCLDITIEKRLAAVAHHRVEHCLFAGYKRHMERL